MFEAIHGSAPRMIQEGLGDYANPASILKALVLLLQHICRPAAAERLLKAMDSCQVAVTGDRDGATCKEYADALISLI